MLSVLSCFVSVLILYEYLLSYSTGKSAKATRAPLTMKLLKQEEIQYIVKQCGNYEILDYTITNYSKNLIGYLGEHLRLTVRVQANGVQTDLKFFMKCMPKDEWIAEFLQESRFFKKEYVMLSQLFKQFECHETDEGNSKWRPKSFLIKEDLFVFEDVSTMGYKMPDQETTMTYNEIMATVQTLARFHAQSFIHEEKKTRELHKPYRIWDDFSEELQEHTNKDWRNAGRDAAIDYLKVFSKHKLQPNFAKNVTELFHNLFEDAYNLMRPSSKYRNTIVHRDLWSNNVLLKTGEEYHALIVDFQTVLYCPPTMDLSSLIYFNTTKAFRDEYAAELLETYYEVLKKEVKDKVPVEFSSILSRSNFMFSYNESVKYGMTQAAIIVPIIAMSMKMREQLFCDPASIDKINNVSRSEEIIELAKGDAAYRNRLTDLFDDIVERYYTIHHAYDV